MPIVVVLLVLDRRQSVQAGVQPVVVVPVDPLGGQVLGFRQGFDRPVELYAFVVVEGGCWSPS